MTNAPHVVAYVQDGGRTHVRHPRWSLLTLCDRVASNVAFTSRPQRITCATCARLASGSQVPRKAPSSPSAVETVDCWLRCSCGHHQERALIADQTIRSALRELSCRACGETGTCSLSPSKTP